MGLFDFIGDAINNVGSEVDYICWNIGDEIRKAQESKRKKKQKREEKEKAEAKKIVNTRLHEYPFKDEKVYLIKHFTSSDHGISWYAFHTEGRYKINDLINSSNTKSSFILNELGKIYPIDDDFYTEHNESTIKKLDDTLRRQLKNVIDDVYSDNSQLLEEIDRKSYFAIKDKLKKAHDYFKKEEYIDYENQKSKSISEAGRKGEDKVSYALKFLDSYNIIDAQSNGAPVCILNKNYIDEEQEYDHIAVGPGGVFLIETKAYSGTITIDDFGNWIREKDGKSKGELNPTAQVRRHEKIIRSILPKDTPIFSIICIANDTTIINGVKNSKIPIVKYDLLVEKIETEYRQDILSNKQVSDIIDIINRYTV